MTKFQVNKEYTLYISKEVDGDRKRLLRLAKKQVERYAPFDILCPAFYDTNKRLFFHGGGFTLFEKVPYPEAQGERNINQYPNIRSVDFSPLWAFIVSNNALKKIKPLPDFGMNIYQHADVCIRAIKAGLNIQVSPDFKTTYNKAYVSTKERRNYITKFKILQQWFKKKHGKWLDDRYKTPVMFHTHTGFPGGYCMHSRAIIKALLNKKIKIHYKFVGGCNDDEPDSEVFPVDDLKNDMGSFKLPQIVLSTGLNCFSNSGEYKIGFTTTEVNGIPKDWVRVLNEMDEVWTTSEFSKESFKSSGVKTPIYNMREGIDPDYFHPNIKPFRTKQKKKFLFISNFAWGKRKGADVLFEAFSKEFSDKEDVAMIIKALPSYHGEDIQKGMAELYHEPNGAPITVWDAVLPPYVLGQFYTAGHCFVFPTRGEGFGIPPAEALASGVPVITSGYSAVTEFLTKNGKKLPGVEFIKGRVAKFDGSDSVYYHGFDWYEPSVSHLRKLMRKVYNNYAEYKKGAMESSKYMRAEWNWDKSADLIIDRINKIYAKRKVK